MEILLTCKYCNHKWESNAYANNNNLVCTRCGDTDISVKELSKTKIDAYVGCPPFENEEKKEDDKKLDLPYWFQGD